MNPSEAAIERAIDEHIRPAPGLFENLAVRYVEIASPEFPNQELIGRSPVNITHKGKPDGRSYSSGGFLGVEATTAQDPSRHIADDINYLRGKKGVYQGFVLVCWANPLTEEKELTLRASIVDTGVPEDKVHVIYKGRLVKDLAAPQFARIWLEMLNLSAHAMPFRSIQDAGLYGKDDMHIFPTRDEFLAGRVHQPALLETVHDRLSEFGWAIVIGKIASGKTILALSIAHERLELGDPVYYLNLAEQPDPCKAIDVIASRGANNVLFVVDNIHLSEQLAHDIYCNWGNFRNGSQLLLLGRTVSNELDLVSQPNPLSILLKESLNLVADASDLRGIYLRLALRRCLKPPEPQKKHLADWENLFSGELLAFSAAVVWRMEKLIRKDWRLEAKDAEKYVYSEYIKNASEAERSALITLAILAKFEIDATLTSVRNQLPDAAIRKGHVHCLQRGPRSEYVHLRLPHSGLGQLLLAASPPGNEMMILQEATNLDPFLASLVASRMEKCGRHQDAVLILSEFINRHNGLFSLLTCSGAHSISQSIPTLQRILNVSFKDLELSLCSDLTEVVDMMLRDRPQIFVEFYKICKRVFPKLAIKVQDRITHESSRHTTSNTGVQTPSQVSLELELLIDRANDNDTSIGELIHFLECCKTDFPNIFRAHCTILMSDSQILSLQEKSLQTPIGSLLLLLKFTRVNMEKLFHRMCETITSQSGLEHLKREALNGPLVPFLALLNFVMTEPFLKTLYNPLKQLFFELYPVDKLKADLLTRQIGQMITIFNYIKAVSPGRYRELTSLLNTKEAIAEIEDLLLRPNCLGRCEVPSEEVLLQDEKTDISPSLNYIILFLKIAKTDINGLLVDLDILLSAESNSCRFSDILLVSPLSDLSSLLDFTKSNMVATNTALNFIFSQPEMLKTLAKKICNTRQLDQILGFIRRFEHSADVISLIDLDEWKKIRHMDAPGQISFQRDLALQLIELGRPDLAEALAQSLIERLEQEDWGESLYLYHLSYILQYSGAASGVHSLIVKQIATEKWLDAQIKNPNPSPGTIADFVYVVWGYSLSEHFPHFCRPSLIKRVVHEAQNLSKNSHEILLQQLQLIGCAELLGVYLNPKSFPCPDMRTVPLLEFFPNPTLQSIKTSQIKLLLGLGSLVRLTGQKIQVPKSIGEWLLELCRSGSALTPRHVQLNQIMTTWLEKCQSNRWSLVPLLVSCGEIFD